MNKDKIIDIYILHIENAKNAKIDKMSREDALGSGQGRIFQFPLWSHVSFFALCIKEYGRGFGNKINVTHNHIMRLKSFVDSTVVCM